MCTEEAGLNPPEVRPVRVVVTTVCVGGGGSLPVSPHHPPVLLTAGPPHLAPHHLLPAPPHHPTVGVHLELLQSPLPSPAQSSLLAMKCQFNAAVKPLTSVG